MVSMVVLLHEIFVALSLKMLKKYHLIVILQLLQFSSIATYQ